MQSIRTIQDFKAFQERISRIENLCQNKCFSLFNCFFFARSKPLINPTILYNPPPQVGINIGQKHLGWVRIYLQTADFYRKLTLFHHLECTFGIFSLSRTIIHH